MTMRREWLEQVTEEIIEPDRPIVDPHHHFWRQGSYGRYLLDDLWRDTGSGHRVLRTVFVECAAEYRIDGPTTLRPVGETEFVAELAAASRQGTDEQAQVCGIVGHADLTLGEAVEEVLLAHIEAGRIREGDSLFRGIRHQASWDASDEVPNSRIDPPPDLYDQPAFRQGVSQLGELGLTFDAWCYHPQLPQLIEVAHAVPETTMILNHLGGPLGIGPYADRRDEIFPIWKESISKLSQCDNVVVKLGGIAMERNGYGWQHQEKPPTSVELAEEQRPWHLTAIELFGPERCMFESNYPVEAISASYHVLWNTFKRVASEFNDAEKDLLFGGTAERMYRLKSR
ncbi:amidohydrolase family protein [Chloroflexi bacterium TSY]|nr:amidohydrolase family protein [Chloroflexi bacterium TSY]